MSKSQYFPSCLNLATLAIWNYIDLEHPFTSLFICLSRAINQYSIFHFDFSKNYNLQSIFPKTSDINLCLCERERERERGGGGVVLDWLVFIKLYTTTTFAKDLWRTICTKFCRIPYTNVQIDMPRTTKKTKWNQKKICWVKILKPSREIVCCWF